MFAKYLDCRSKLQIQAAWLEANKTTLCQLVAHNTMTTIVIKEGGMLKSLYFLINRFPPLVTDICLLIYSSIDCTNTDDCNFNVLCEIDFHVSFLRTCDSTFSKTTLN